MDVFHFSWALSMTDKSGDWWCTTKKLKTSSPPLWAANFNFSFACSLLDFWYVQVFKVWIFHSWQKSSNPSYVHSFPNHQFMNSYLTTSSVQCRKYYVILGLDMAVIDLTHTVQLSHCGNCCCEQCQHASCKDATHHRII